MKVTTRPADYSEEVVSECYGVTIECAGVEYRISDDDNQLTINVMGRLVVLPKASNVINVKVEEYISHNVPNE